MIEYADLAVCNCAGCNRLLHGERQASLFRHGALCMDPARTVPPVVSYRWNGRPFCEDCARLVLVIHTSA